ncbi:MAG TPA: ATP-binding protein, partial [Gammaproteobacteria bacterium]|nr:ATP-binding protein [Gammaproteobacteria bacterium]
ITSASYDEKALDVTPGGKNHRDGATPADGHSPFAAALLRGLAGTADSARAGQEPDGVMTATEIYQYVYDELVPRDSAAQQTPGIWPLRPDNKGEFIFHSPATEKRTIPDPPLDDANNPWHGLTAYTREDTALFFGRERVVAALLERTLDPARPALLAVVGASGTGKSSVVRAGLLPLLSDPPDEQRERIGQWCVVASARLRGDPGGLLDACIEQLHAADSSARKVLFIDQFEELYTRCPQAEQRSAYLQRLREIIDADNATTVVLTLRSDFEPRPAASDALEDVWLAARYLVPALTSEEFRECIIGPAQVKALYFEPDELVGELVDEVMSMPGALPMLSFALSEMYQRARARRRETGALDRALTRADYEAAGGVVGALHRRADKLYASADDDSKRTIRNIFLRMLSQQGGQLTRRRIDLDEIEYGDSAEQGRVKRVVADYVDARLLVIDGEEIEPAHDTIVVAWDKLLEWLSNAPPLNLFRAWWRAAADWRNNERDKGLLWDDDPRLPVALRYRDEANRLETEFMDASVRRRRRGRNVRIGISASAVLAVLITFVLLLEQQIAADNADRARDERDTLYLGLLEGGNFFRIDDVLDANSQAGVLEPSAGEAGEWWELVADEDAPFVIARPYGEGRVMAIGHEALLTYVEPEFGDAFFLDVALTWLGGSDNARIVFSDGHNETLPWYHETPWLALLDRLRNQDYETELIADFAVPGALDEAGMIVVANAWLPFEPAEIDAIVDFVDDGGGLLAAGLGWSWVQIGWPEWLESIRNADPTAESDAVRALDNYPMNQLMAPFGMQWVDGVNAVDPR